MVCNAWTGPCARVAVACQAGVASWTAGRCTRRGAGSMMVVLCGARSRPTHRSSRACQLTRRFTELARLRPACQFTHQPNHFQPQSGNCSVPNQSAKRRFERTKITVARGSLRSANLRQAGRGTKGWSGSLSSRFQCHKCRLGPTAAAGEEAGGLGR